MQRIKGTPYRDGWKNEQLIAHATNARKLDDVGEGNSTEVSTKDPTSSPTSTVYPSISPSSTTVPSYSPSSVPTDSVMPSTSPSKYPSPKPSVRPTIQPTLHPSFRPTLTPSLIPSQKPSTLPSYSLRSKTFYYLEMTLNRMDHLLHTSIDQDFWRDVTSNHVLDFYQGKLLEIEESIQIITVKTSIIRQYELHPSQGDGRNLRGIGNSSEIGYSFRRLHREGLNQFSHLRIIYNQEILYRGSENVEIPETVVTAPFLTPERNERYMQHLKEGLDGELPTESFEYLLNINIEHLRSEIPSMSPSNAPSLIPSAQPSIELRRNQIGTIVVPILICLIILMVAATVWFCFVHKTAGSDVTLGRHLYNALLQYQWKRRDSHSLNLRNRNRPGEHNPLSDATNATGQNFDFPIRDGHHHMPDDLSMSMISDPVVTISNLSDSPIRKHGRVQDIREQDHEYNTLNLDDSENGQEGNARTVASSSSKERKLMITLPDEPLTPSLKLDGTTKR